MKAENLRHLNTATFNDTINAYANYVKQFESIVSDVNTCLNKMVLHWKGEGKNAFERDYKQVQLNLNEVSNIMYEIRDSLNDAQVEYLKTDLALSKEIDTWAGEGDL